MAWQCPSCLAIVNDGQLHGCYDVTRGFPIPLPRVAETGATFSGGRAEFGQIVAQSAMDTAAEMASGNFTGRSAVVSGAQLMQLDVTPKAPTIAHTTTQQFKALGTFDNGAVVDMTQLVTWVSSAPGQATINANGLATGVAAGTTNITVRLANGFAHAGRVDSVPVVLTLT